MFNLVERENLIFNILNEFVNHDLRFVLVGGYAVSAYKHRFSVDADIIIKEEDLGKFTEILKKNKFNNSITKALEHVYASEFKRYETSERPPASVDILINGIGSRTTGASFSMEQIEEHSQKRKITGTEKEVLAVVPEKEVLIALKIHSGRLTDFRDIAALCKDLNLEIIKKYLNVGDRQILTKNINQLQELIEKKEFISSFKGVFQEKKYDLNLNEIRKLKELLRILH